MIRRPKAAGKGGAMRRERRALHGGAMRGALLGPALGAIALFGLSAGSARAQQPADGTAATGGAVPPTAVAVAPEASQAPAVTLPTVVVVGTTPLLGIGTPLQKVPANVQTVRAAELDAQHRATLADFFAANLQSVTISEAQGNPYQTDVNYRGFTASPLLGTPQGLSVFVDGVRVNEPFGDVVNWDILPTQAIDRMQLIPGSNPVYGRNTLGGALAITTKNGKSNPGGEAEVSGGSWGRKTAALEQGGTIGSNLDYYATANVANDGGWADHNASRVRQAFGKLRYTDSDTTLSISAGGADNALYGTQTIPRSFLDNRKQAYTYPDLNRNSAGYLTLSGDHFFGEHVELSGNAYYRHLRNTNISSNNNTDYGSVGDDGTVDAVQGTNAQSTIVTDSYGGSLQLTLLGKLGGMANQLIAGVAADVANSSYVASSQDAYFTDTRAAIGVGDFEPQTRAKTRNANLGVYLSDALSLTPHWTLTVSGRYDWSKAQIGDESGVQPLLDGNHVFSRFNPAVGLNWNPVAGFTAYATYNEGMRSPTAIELACADPAAPCSLPNDFIADPALKPVISKTFEAGMRGRIGAATTWSAAAYRTTLTDDIQFISSPASAQGYFRNVGDTRRQGIELAGRTRFGPLGVGLSYSYVDATYRSSWTEHSPANSAADANGNVAVKQGDHIPGIPAHTVKLRLDYAATPRWDIGANVTWRSGVYARGDENNQDVNGRIAGYVLVDLDMRYRITKRFEVFASVTNLFDKRYASFGVLGQNFFNGPNHTFDGANPVNEQFVGPGAPRGAWVGVRYAWD
ncbi:TPA: TonB-dependent receptor [Burkholderia cepacia ATCC 25416]|uniref:TonB-dependent receptor n=1 Tax=Burkholderia cepacia TaxID=292 RepID=UPI001CF1DE47|nr:TonB-dependent receptor [Burkholderia cepacia]HDR9766916.1 TonB-dependent receptor [Burkholderia cepacia ATCC 25416]MCA8077528.1 TonB-dependent receptor [Burkholderia cepacia]HDR9774248.1 TonB-dependent receptor [Burkholderia cepacia ATCC 25416]HDR9781212.1 TonB-dependent receptor [Burkholderia cepacia ATCC 25416]HDR9790992.1 TonB-dependent receptor [Burkholderia cepacia ATCC 25416]